jgi:hypothetical protein
MKKLILSIFLSTIVLIGNTQIVLTDNYTNTAIWSELDDVDNQINLNSGLLISNTTWSLSNPDQSNARIYRSLGTTLRNTDRLKVDIDFKVSQNLSNQNGLILFSLCQNSNQPYVTRNSDYSYDCKKNSSICVSLGDGFISLQLKGLNSFQNNTSTCPNSFSRDIYGLNLTTGVKYYFRYIKQMNAHRIQIFSNPTRLNTSKVFDTLLCSSIASDSLAYFMHGNQSVAGWDRTFEVSIDTSSIEKISNDNITNCGNASLAKQMNETVELSNFPNPVNNYTIINYNIPYPIKTSRIFLSSILGQVIKEYVASHFLGNNSIKIETDDLPTGSYFYTLELDGAIVQTQKLLIER